MTDELKTEQTELVELTQADRELGLIIDEVDGQVYDMTATLGRAQAVANRKKLRDYWVQVGKTSTTMKRHLDNKKKLITSKTAELVERAKLAAEPIDAVIKEYEAEVEARKETERLRKKGIQDVIHALRETASKFHGATSEKVRDGISLLVEYDVDDSFMEFKEQATAAIELALVDMEELFSSTLKTEQADAARKEESERLAKQKEEQDEREAKLLAQEEEAALETVAKDMEKEPEPTAMRKDIETAKVEVPELASEEGQIISSGLLEKTAIKNRAPLSKRLQGVIDLTEDNGSNIITMSIEAMQCIIEDVVELESAREGEADG